MENPIQQAIEAQPPEPSDEDEELRWPTYYWGRKWDAPMTDGAILMNETLVYALFPQPCNLCSEPITPDDDIWITPGMCFHLECTIRVFSGDVRHLEGRCICAGQPGPQEHDDDEDETYREGAKAALQWLIDNKRGRFHDADV